MPGRELPPSAYQPWLPFRGRWLKPRGFEIKGGAEPVMILADNPNRYGAYIFNAGGIIELPIPIPQFLPAGTYAASFVDTGLIAVPPYALSSYKSLYLVVTTTLAWTTGGQPTAQLVIGRSAWSGNAGSGSAVTNNGFSTKGAAVNLGPAAATTLAGGIWPFSPVDIADLQWPHPFIGLELKFPSALNSGAMQLMLETVGGPMVLLGEDNSINPAYTGDRANAFALPADSGPILWQGDGELWAAATPGGIADLRVVEIAYRQPNTNWQQT